MADLIRISRQIGVDPREVVSLEVVGWVDYNKGWLELRMRDNMFYQSDFLPDTDLRRLQTYFTQANPNINITARQHVTKPPVNV